MFRTPAKPPPAPVTAPAAAPTWRARAWSFLLTQAAPRTLRSRLAITQVALVVAVLAVLGLYLAILFRDLYVDRLADDLVEEARLVGNIAGPTINAGGGIAEVDPIVKRLGSQIDGRVTIIAADGTVLGDSEADPRTMENHAQRPEVREALTGGVGESERHSDTIDADLLYVAIPIAATPGAVARIAIPLDDVNATIGRIRRDIAIAAIAAALITAGVAIFVARRITGPLDDLRRQTSAVAAGHLDVGVEPVPTLELGDLGRSFNVMTGELRTLVDELERSRARLEVMLANLTDGVIITDVEGSIVLLNAAAAVMFGTTETDAAGRPLVQVSRDHDLAALLRDALATNQPRRATIDYAFRARVLDAAARPLVGARERLALVVVRDVTELRRLETVRREFVANVSHELRTPLASIKALVETLEAGAIDDPEVAGDFLSRIVGEVDRLAALVDELLDLARLESGRIALKLEALDPVDLIAGGVARLRPQTERARVALTVDISPDLPRVRADRTRIEQVVLNLVHNAIKFTPAGGAIVVGATADEQFLTVSVRDTGVGIAAAELPRLFERFYKADKARRSDGTGLGLAIAKHIVQAHGGSIWADSQPGQGSTFSFTLALATAPLPATVRPSRS